MRPTLPLLLVLPLLACGKKDQGDSGSSPTEANVSIALEELPPTSRARLARVLTVTADVPVAATVTLDDGATHQRTVSPPHTGTEFTVAIPGFRQDRTYAATVVVHAVDGGAELARQTFDVTTLELPAPMAEFDLLVDDGRPDRGDTIFPIRTESGAGFMAMVDAEGELIWALDGGGTWWRTVRVLEGGDILVIADQQVIRTDWGDLDPVAWSPPAGTDGYHHEAIARPGGGFFAFTAGGLQVPNIPNDYSVACDPGQPFTIWDSIVVEADADGNPIQQWSLGERLDTHRLGWNSLDPTPIGPDWGHANGMQYLEDDDAFLISMRNQDLVLKLSRATGQIEWILSNPWGWDSSFEPLRLQPEDPDFRWTFHQHAPEWEDGRLLVHDNGAENDMPCGPADAQDRGTRAVEFEIDEANRTVREVWSWENGLYSPIMGDADRLSGGRILISYGQVDTDEAGVANADKGRGNLSSRLIEVDKASGAVLWDLEVYEADRAQNIQGFKVPRSQRITDWWPR